MNCAVFGVCGEVTVDSGGLLYVLVPLDCLTNFHASCDVSQ